MSILPVPYSYALGDIYHGSHTTFSHRLLFSRYATIYLKCPLLTIAYGVVGIRF